MSKDFLRLAAEKYYDGEPIIPDDVYDYLAAQKKFLEVGAPVPDGVRHFNRLYSLQKFYTGEEVPYFSEMSIETPKLDGAAVALYYINGELLSILTRGDGIVGKDISRFIPVFPAPKKINSTEPILQITGELVAPKTIPRSRQYAAGAMGLKDIQEFNSRNLTFVAYSVYPTQKTTYLADMRNLLDLGFKVVVDYSWDEFPQDGKVYRINDNELFESKGYTAHHPKGAFALKTNKEGVVSKLLDVVWQVGRTGIVAPVAVLEPVEVDGVTISRATLHNLKYIEALDLEIGCDVRVVRAGEIIPRILGRN